MNVLLTLKPVFCFIAHSARVACLVFLNQPSLLYVTYSICNFYMIFKCGIAIVKVWEFDSGCGFILRPQSLEVHVLWL